MTQTRNRKRRIAKKSAAVTIPPITYVLRDDFSTDAAAPLASPRTSEPTGTLTLVQTDGQLSVNSGALIVPTQATPVGGDLGFYGAAMTAVNGRAVLTKLTAATLGSSGWSIGWKPTANANFESGERYGVQIAATTIMRVHYATTGLQVVGGAAAAVEYRIAVVIQPNGITYYVRGNPFSAWTLLWQHNGTIPSTLIPVFGSMNNSGSIDTVRVVDLGGAFAQDRGFAVVNTTAANNTDYSGSAASFIDLTITAPAILAGNAGFQWRRVDANNYHYVGFTSGGALRAYKVVDGVTTEYATTVTHAGVIIGGATRTIRIVVSPASLIRWNDWNGTVWTQRGSTQIEPIFSDATTIRPIMESAWSSGGGSLGALVVQPVTAVGYDALDRFF